MSARDAARRALASIGQDRFASAALDRAVEEAGLGPADRALATELVYGVLRHRSRLDRALTGVARRGLGRTSTRLLDVLRIGAYQLLLLDRVPAHAAVDDAARAARSIGGPRAAGFVNATLRALADAGEPPLPPRSGNARRYIEEALSVPAWIVGQLAEALEDTPDEQRGGVADEQPDELIRAAEALCAAAPLAIRVNRLRATVDEVRDALRAERSGAAVRLSSHAPAALLVEGLGSPARSRSHAAGLWTVQDVGAQRVGLVAAPRAGSRILDACAGVGGKSTHLAELCADDVHIDALDVSADKLALLRGACARLGIGSVHPVVGDLRDPNALPAGAAYQLVVVDAPCTGLGVLRRHPEAKWRAQWDDVLAMEALQDELLEAAVARVAPGGALIYSVCTFTRREGPARVAALLERHPALTLEHAERTWPHRHEADAFYLARLRRH